MSGKIQSACVGQEGRTGADGPSLWGTSFSVWIEQTELNRMLAAYDPNVGTSPGVTDARQVARPVFDSAIVGPPEVS